MRFNNIDIYSEHDHELTDMIRKESSHIIDMYLRLLKYYDNSHCKKLNICCNEKIMHPYISSRRNGYIRLHMPFCPGRFSSLSPPEKSLFYLNLISSSILHIGAQWDWNLSYFDGIRCHILASNFKNQWMHGKPSPSPDRSKRAYLKIVQTIDRAGIFLVITQNKRVTKKIQVTTAEPVFWIYRQYLGHIRWIDSSHLEIAGKAGEIIFEVCDL